MVHGGGQPGDLGAGVASGGGRLATSPYHLFSTIILLLPPFVSFIKIFYVSLLCQGLNVDAFNLKTHFFLSYGVYTSFHYQPPPHLSQLIVS